MRRVYEEKPTSYKFLSLNNILSLIRYMMLMSNFQHLLKNVCWSVTTPPPKKRKKKNQRNQGMLVRLWLIWSKPHYINIVYGRSQLGISYLWEFGPVHILGIDASSWHYAIYSHRDWYELTEVVVSPQFVEDSF